MPGGAPLPYWAADRTGDNSLRDKARSHVARHLDYVVRTAGSVLQSATFDVITGNLVRTYTHKGVTDDSTWARAQAWAMLGLAQACQHDPGYFTSPAIQVCDWWCEHRPSATSPTGTSTQSQPWGDATRPAGILGDGCYNRRIGLALRNELVWGTHFLLEALLTLTGQIDTALV